MTATGGAGKGGTADALKAAGDIIKVSTGLATGALVFSVGLLANAPSYTNTTRILIIVSWGLLLISIILGVFSQAAIPVLMSDQDYDIENPYFTWPGRLHQVAFGLAIIMLAVALSKVVYSEPTTLRVPTATDAVIQARSAISSQYEITRLNKVELIKAPSDRPSNTTWHTEFEVKQRKVQEGVTASQPRYLNILIDAYKGNILTVQ